VPATGAQGGRQLISLPQHRNSIEFFKKQFAGKAGGRGNFAFDPAAINLNLGA
jgi:hypothetical protein